MAKQPFKMAGMSFKGETPIKAINLSNVASKIKGSKFGKTKVGEVIGNLAEKGGKVQEKFVAGKKSLGLNTDGYDATVKKSNEGDTTPHDYTADINDTVPTTATPNAGVDLQKVAAGPIERKKKKKK